MVADDIITFNSGLFLAIFLIKHNNKSVFRVRSWISSSIITLYPSTRGLPIIIYTRVPSVTYSILVFSLTLDSNLTLNPTLVPKSEPFSSDTLYAMLMAAIFLGKETNMRSSPAKPASTRYYGISICDCAKHTSSFAWACFGQDYDCLIGV